MKDNDWIKVKVLANKTFSTSNIISTSKVFRRSNFWNKTETERNDNMFCKQRQMAIMAYFIRYKTRRFIYLFPWCGLNSYPLCVFIVIIVAEMWYFETVLQVLLLFKQRKREIVLLLLQLCLHNTQWVDTFVGSFICFYIIMISPFFFNLSH